MRRLRAVVMVTLAMTVASTVSYGYLRPAPSAARPAPATVAQTMLISRQHLSYVVVQDGGDYSSWVRDIGSSGGHR